MKNEHLEIHKIKVSISGTISVTATIKPMRKAEDFSVYPINENTGVKYLSLQSSKRWVDINSINGDGIISKAANYPNRTTPKAADFKLSDEQREALNKAIRETSAKECGKGMIVCDNSHAHLVGLAA